MKSILALSLSILCAVAAQAQRTQTSASGQGNSQSSATIAQGARSINLESGTSLAAELQNTVDVRKAKVGDQVVLKTTQAIKAGGQTVVKKGARLVGHVTEVAQRGKGNGESRVGLVFDRLEQGSLAMPITATISSITSSRTNASAGSDDMFGTTASGSGRASTSSSASSSSGGLLGGVGGLANSTTSTVGSVVGGTTSAVGSTVNSTTNTLGSTTSGVGRSLGRIRISESSSTSVQGGAVLSLQGDNLRLEKGTNFNLVLSQSAIGGTAPDQ